MANCLSSPNYLNLNFFVDSRAQCRTRCRTIYFLIGNCVRTLCIIMFKLSKKVNPFHSTLKSVSLLIFDIFFSIVDENHFIFIVLKMTDGSGIKMGRIEVSCEISLSKLVLGRTQIFLTLENKNSN